MGSSLFIFIFIFIFLSKRKKKKEKRFLLVCKPPSFEQIVARQQLLEGIMSLSCRRASRRRQVT